MITVAGRIFAALSTCWLIVSTCSAFDDFNSAQQQAVGWANQQGPDGIADEATLDRLGVVFAVKRSKQVDLTGDRRLDTIIAAFIDQGDKPRARRETHFGSVLIFMGAADERGHRTILGIKGAGATYLGADNGERAFNYVDAQLQALIQGKPVSASLLPAWKRNDLSPCIGASKLRDLASQQTWQAARASKAPLWCRSRENAAFPPLGVPAILSLRCWVYAPSQGMITLFAADIDDLQDDHPLFELVDRMGLPVEPVPMEAIDR